MSTDVVVDGERGVLRARSLAILIALAEVVGTRRVSELCGLRQEFRGVLIILEQYVVDAAFMQNAELVQRMRELRGGIFTRTLQQVDRRALVYGQPELAVELRSAQAVERTGVLRRRRLLEKRDGFGGVALAAPAVLAAGTRAVASVRMAALRREDEQRICFVEILTVAGSTETVGVAISECIL